MTSQPTPSLSVFFPAYNDSGTIASLVISAVKTAATLTSDYEVLVINDGTTPGLGEVTFLSGRVLDSRGQPVRNALVEIWQADAGGIYRHSQDNNDGRQQKRDKNFQSFGRFLTGTSGEYLFRTIVDQL